MVAKLIISFETSAAERLSMPEPLSTPDVWT
jgi:hypothetical protein